jgi:hypothetical protein
MSERCPFFFVCSVVISLFFTRLCECYRLNSSVKVFVLTNCIKTLALYFGKMLVFLEMLMLICCFLKHMLLFFLTHNLSTRKGCSFNGKKTSPNHLIILHITLQQLFHIHLHSPKTRQEVTFLFKFNLRCLALHMAISFKKIKNRKMKPICKLYHSRSDEENNFLKN